MYLMLDGSRPTMVVFCLHLLITMPIEQPNHLQFAHQQTAATEIWQFRSARNPIRENANFTVQQEVDLFNSAYYFQLASLMRPNGEV
jgi:predicted membrane-bound dolichyl-phosphate-mannose-protein mannosyltransferase